MRYANNINVHTKNKSNKIGSVPSIIMILLAVCIFSQIALTNEKAPITIKEALKSSDQEIQNRTIDKILDDREKQVDMLIEIVKEMNEGKATQQAGKAAAYLLGEMRAQEAVQVLSIALKQPDLQSDFNRFRGAIFNALVSIGRPSIPPMITNITSSDDQLLRQNSMLVIGQVLGTKDNLIRLLNTLLEQKERTQEEKNRLKQSIEWAQSTIKESEKTLY